MTSISSFCYDGVNVTQIEWILYQSKYLKIMSSIDALANMLVKLFFLCLLSSSKFGLLLLIIILLVSFYTIIQNCPATSATMGQQSNLVTFSYSCLLLVFHFLSFSELIKRMRTAITYCKVIQCFNSSNISSFPDNHIIYSNNKLLNVMERFLSKNSKIDI